MLRIAKVENEHIQHHLVFQSNIPPVGGFCLFNFPWAPGSCMARPPIQWRYMPMAPSRRYDRAAGGRSEPSWIDPFQPSTSKCLGRKGPPNTTRGVDLFGEYIIYPLARAQWMMVRLQLQTFPQNSDHLFLMVTGIGVHTRNRPWLQVQIHIDHAGTTPKVYRVLILPASPWARARSYSYGNDTCLTCGWKIGVHIYCEVLLMVFQPPISRE